MPNFKVEVNRRYLMSEVATFDIEAENEEKAKEIALEEAKYHSEYFEPFYEPDIEYEIDEDAIEKVDNNEPKELRWGEND